MDAVTGSDFDMTGEWDMVGVLKDNMFELLCLTYTAPRFYLVML